MGYLSHIRARQAIATLCIILALPCAAQEFGFQCFSLEDGLPRSTVTAIMEDEQGFLWLGTEGGGLVRFDGHAFVTYGTKVGLTGVTVGCIAQGRQNELLVGTAPVGLSRINGGRITPLSIAERMPNAELTDILVDSSGVIWCATKGSGVVRIDDDGPTVFGKANGLAHENVNVLVLARDGSIYAGTDRGLSQYREGKWGKASEEVSESPILSMVMDSTLKVFGTNTGINGSITSNLLDGQQITCLLLDRSQRLWAGTPHGVWLINEGGGQDPVHITEQNGLTNDDIRSLYQDRSGAIWIGTAYGGVCKFTSDAFSHYTGKSGLMDPMITSIHRDTNGHLVLRTAHGETYMAKDGALVHTILASPMDTISIAYRQGKAYAATARGLLDGDSIRSPQGLSPVANADVLLHVPMTSIAAASNGDLWIGAKDQGVIRWDGETTTQYTIADGLSANEVTLVMLDAYENVWVGTRNGINRMELDVMQERVIDIDNYSTADGFIGMEVLPNSGMLDYDSTLWFGTTKGATRYDPRRVFVDDHEPRTRITDIELMRQNVDWAAYSDTLDPVTGLPVHLELPYNKAQLTFLFAGISLADPNKVVYQYILEGQDPDWSPITAQDEVTYSNITPGAHTFKVIARNASGIWNQVPETFTFTITPPFWQTTWFQLGGALLLLFGIWGFVRMRTYRLRKKQDQLEGMVQTRTFELADQVKRSDELLLNILPQETADELKLYGKAAAKEYKLCSVLFSDFKGFTTLSEHMTGDTLVHELDRYFRSFDRVTDEYGIEKIKTIGDAYMCACGLPKERKSHALDAVLMGMQMIHIVDRLNRERTERGIAPWPIRIGIHTGPVVAGVVGEKKFAYDIWGDTVNLASRMESNGEESRINISGATYAQIMDYVQCSPRGPLEVKGKGEVQMYFVERLRPEFSMDEEGLLPNEALDYARHKEVISNSVA